MSRNVEWQAGRQDVYLSLYSMCVSVYKYVCQQLQVCHPPSVWRYVCISVFEWISVHKGVFVSQGIAGRLAKCSLCSSVGFFRGKAAVRGRCCDDRRKWSQRCALNCSAALKKLEVVSAGLQELQTLKLSGRIPTTIRCEINSAVDRNKARTSCFLLMMQSLE